jgi:serine/threonine-protein kinase MRCK
MENPERRLKDLESIFLNGPVLALPTFDGPSTFSIETLLDILLILYDECCNSSLRREKTVTDFLSFGKLLKYKLIRIDYT